MNFKDKTCLITGASRGLGAAFAEALAANGTHIIAVARTTGGLEELDDRIQSAGGQATLVPLDITDDAAVKRMCMSIHERWGGLDFWLNTAIHATPLAPVSHIDPKDWAKSEATNITGLAHMIVNIAPLLTAKSGTAIYAHDPAVGQKFFGNYGAAKAAQRALFDSWAAENTKVKILNFTPAPMPTATRARFFPGEDRAMLSSPKAEAAKLIGLLQ